MSTKNDAQAKPEATAETSGGEWDDALRQHVVTCPQCSGPDDGCEEGQQLERFSITLRALREENQELRRKHGLRSTELGNLREELERVKGGDWQTKRTTAELTALRATVAGMGEALRKVRKDNDTLWTDVSTTPWRADLHYGIRQTCDAALAAQPEGKP